LRFSAARSLLACGAVLVASTLLPAWGIATARANVASTIIERCTHGESIAGYPRSAYAQALGELPTVVSEYSDCEELIRKAELAAITGGVGGLPGAFGTGGSGLLGTPGAIPPPTPAEQEILSASGHTRAAPAIKVGNSVEQPGVLHVNLASALNSLPTPLLALLALLLALGAAVGGSSLRNSAPVRSLPFRIRRRK
jgi:hypothetical protein